MANHRADEKRFLDERGSGAALAPNGLNPATIMEKAVRERIVGSYFWKDRCFGVNEADVVTRVVEHVGFVGGTYGDGAAQRPSPFLCLAFKLLQLAPSDAVLAVYLDHGGPRFKYLRALACFYIRLTRPAKDVFRLLEPYLADRRKLKRRTRTHLTLTYMDQFVDDLLTKDRLCATTLWKLPRREILEDLDVLDPRISPLGDIDDLLDEEEDLQDIPNGRDSESAQSPGAEFGEVTLERETEPDKRETDAGDVDEGEVDEGEVDDGPDIRGRRADDKMDTS